MRAKNAAVGVHFIDDYKAEPLEERLPDRVVGKDALMEHIRVCQQENRLFAHSGTHVLRSIPIEDVGRQRFFGGESL